MSNVKYVCGDNPQRDVTQQVLAACGGEPVLVPTTLESFKRASAVVRTDADDQPLLVRIECTSNQWCDFRCGPHADGDVVQGTPVGPEEVARWKTWQSYTDPLKGLERIEKYGKWVLGAATMVTALATALAVSNALPLSTSWAKWLYFAAVACLGFSWVAVSLTFAPKWVQLHRDSPTDFVAKFNNQFRWRRAFLFTAATLLALALALAALVPLAGLWRDRVPSAAALTYDVKPSGEITAHVNGEGLPPRTPVEIHFTGSKALLRGTLPLARATVATDGKVQATLTLDSTRAHAVGRPLKVVGRWQVIRDRTPVPSGDSILFQR